MRLFYAINLSDESKEKIEELKKELKENGVNGRFVKEEDLHITMRFLGEVDEDDVLALQRIADITAKKIRKVSLKLDRVAYWDKFGKKQMYISIKNADILERIYKMLNKELEKIGYSREKRKYQAHITIGRNMFLSKRTNLEEQSKIINNYEFDLESLDLIQSYKDDYKLMYKNLYNAKIN